MYEAYQASLFQVEPSWLPIVVLVVNLLVLAGIVLLLVLLGRYLYQKSELTKLHVQKERQLALQQEKAASFIE